MFARLIHEIVLAIMPATVAHDSCLHIEINPTLSQLLLRYVNFDLVASLLCNMGIMLLFYLYCFSQSV